MLALTSDITPISREIFSQCVSEAMASLSDVVGIIDIDRFLMNKKFFCKELGIIRVGDLAAHSFFLYWSKLAGFIGEG